MVQHTLKKGYLRGRLQSVPCLAALPTHVSVSVQTAKIIAACMLPPVKIPNPQVAKLCELAHIELAPEGGGSSSDGGVGSGSGSSGNLDVATVQKDVGAMLRCMQTMRRDVRESEGEDGEEEEEEEDGPWGGAAPWAAPLQEVGSETRVPGSS